jgi:hypothetical protein
MEIGERCPTATVAFEARRPVTEEEGSTST